MTPSPRRAGRRLDEALAQALEDLERGLTPLQILDRYPEYEAEFAPLLETAYGLRTTRWPTLSMAARVSGRERMHGALTEHKARRVFVVAPICRQIGAGLALAVLASMTYLASPVSPFRGLSRPRPIATTIVATATWTATWTVQPSPTLEPSSTKTISPSPTPTATQLVNRTPEPTERAERLQDWFAWPTSTPTTTPTATTVPSAPPTVAATHALPVPTRTPIPAATPEPPEQTRMRQGPPTVPETKAPAAVSSSSAVQAVKEEQKPKPAGMKANGVGPAHEQRDATKESRKTDQPRVKGHKP